MKFIEHNSEEQKVLKSQGWFVAHVVPGIGNIEIACMEWPHELPLKQKDLGRHVWKGTNITDDCGLCGESYDNRWHA